METDLRREPSFQESAVPMPPPRQIDNFAYREFKVILVQDGGRIRARAYDARRKQVDEVSGQTLDEVKADIKMRLNPMSEDFVGIDGAVNLFYKAFPGSFACKYHKFRERDYKEQTSEFIATRLAAEEIDELRPAATTRPFAVGRHRL
jgi:hypothetical protein